MRYATIDQIKLWNALPDAVISGEKGATFPWIDLLKNERLWEKFWMQEYMLGGGVKALDNILDFGCGVGWGWFVANTLGFKNVIPLDIKSERMQKVFAPFVEILQPPIVYWDGKKLPFETDHFISVVAKTSILKCVNSNLETVIAELARVTKVGGTWFIAPKYQFNRLCSKMLKNKLFDLTDLKNIEIKYWKFDDGISINE